MNHQVSERERLTIEIDALSAAIWLLKDRHTVQECLEELDRAILGRQNRLERLLMEAVW